MNVPGPEDSTSVRITRRLEASCERVYRAFTDPGLLLQWWGPKGFTIDELDFQVKPGGTYRVSLRAPDGSRFVHIGTFIEARPFSRLVYTWRWIEGPLQRNDTLVEIDLVEDGADTILHICHSRFADEAERDRHTGWADSVDRLTEWVVTAGS